MLDFFAKKKGWIILALGFSSGLPVALTAGTLQAWMKSEGVDLSVIGLFSLVGLPYTLKFLWAPLMDRFAPPVLGRRRGWILIFQILLILLISGFAFFDPKMDPFPMALIAFLISFASASQDIVIDGYRADVVTADEAGPASSVGVLGYRVAMLFSGAVALILSDQMSWKQVYLLMAVSLGVGVFATFFSEEPETNVKPPASLRDAVVLPFLDFFRRKGSLEILSFLVVYKLDVVMTLALMTPFLLELEFTRTDIGAVTKGVGLVATLLGTLLGGGLVAKWGIKTSLWRMGIAQAVSGLSFWLLATFGKSYPMMAFAISSESFFSGMGNSAYAAFLLRLCNRNFSVTQYALLSSLMALTRVIAGAPTGFLVAKVGWSNFYFIAFLAAIPGLVLLSRFDQWKFEQTS